MKAIFFFLPLVALATSCETSFYGSSTVTHKECEIYCKENNMELAGMTLMGEYSNGCICKVPDSRSSHEV